MQIRKTGWCQVENLACSSVKICVVVGCLSASTFDILSSDVSGLDLLCTAFHLCHFVWCDGNSKEARYEEGHIPHLLERLCALDPGQQESQPCHQGPQHGQCVGVGGVMGANPRPRQHTTGLGGYTWARKGSDRGTKLEGSLGVLQINLSWCRWKSWSPERGRDLLKVTQRVMSLDCSPLPWFMKEKKKVKVKSLSHVRLFATPWTVAYQAPLSMGFSRQEYWSGLPFPSPWNSDW